ncbi:MAG: rhomboid family intramembrane serine protease [Deltaproteobacteria bacterium]|nr:rhomboid family intramembrane serine protease [Deltaproteobacteria bacterium]
MSWPITEGDGGVHVPTIADLAAADGDAFGYVGPVRERRIVKEWALVLASQGIAHAPVFTIEGWVIRVPLPDEARALEAVRLYQDENRDWPPPERRDVPRHRPTYLVAAAFALLLVFFVAVTGPASRASVWFASGRADAHLLFSEPWRMVTALTLHGDSQHVIGNVVSGSIFATAVSRRIGAGAALLSVTVAGALGNAANALYHHFGRGHLSIGASTAVFGAIGILAGFQTVLLLARRHEPRRRKLRTIDLAGPLAGGLALLGSLGSGGENTDLGAHGFGFLAGLLLGGLTSVMMLRRSAASRPSVALQVLLGSLAGLVIAGSWAVALRA